MKIIEYAPYNCASSKWHIPYKYCIWSDHRKCVIFPLWPFFALGELLHKSFIYIVLKYLKINRIIKKVIKQEAIKNIKK